MGEWIARGLVQLARIGWWVGAVCLILWGYLSAFLGLRKRPG